MTDPPRPPTSVPLPEAETRPLGEAAALAALPAVWPEDLRAEIAAARRAEGRALVVLDDDPTGTQTVHGVPVLTTWDEPALAEELRRSDCLFVLTNSRSLPEAEAAALGRTLGANLAAAVRAAGRDVAVVSRSDSTLRGHFPAEVDAVLDGMGRPVDAVVLAPWFLDGGRLTLHGVHYARTGDDLVPVGRTESAADASFGYERSYLPAWVEEKTGGAVPAAAVAHIPIERIRGGGPAAVAAELAALPSPSYVGFDAAAEEDIEVVVAALLRAEAAGRRHLYRTGASFVRVRAAIAARPPLPTAAIEDPNGRGRLVVVGSHVPRSTEQLEALLGEADVVAVELAVDAVLADAAGTTVAAAAAVEAALAAGRDVVLHTSRAVRTGADAAASLAIAAAVSDALAACVGSLHTRPRLLVAKGGITSSDVATEALGVRRAMVLGQVQAGVPVWELGPESRFPGLRYVVFPGNVGTARSLVDLLRAARAAAEPGGGAPGAGDGGG